MMQRQTSDPRIILASVSMEKLVIRVGVAVSPGMSGEGHAVAQGWIDANVLLLAQGIADTRKARARVVRGGVLVCRCPACHKLHVELWEPIRHAEMHLAEKSRLHAYNSALSMVN